MEWSTLIQTNSRGLNFNNNDKDLGSYWSSNLPSCSKEAVVSLAVRVKSQHHSPARQTPPVDPASANSAFPLSSPSSPPHLLRTLYFPRTLTLSTLSSSLLQCSAARAPLSATSLSQQLHLHLRVLPTPTRLSLELLQLSSHRARLPPWPTSSPHLWVPVHTLSTPSHQSNTSTLRILRSNSPIPRLLQDLSSLHLSTTSTSTNTITSTIWHWWEVEWGVVRRRPVGMSVLLRLWLGAAPTVHHHL